MRNLLNGFFLLVALTAALKAKSEVSNCMLKTASDVTAVTSSHLALLDSISP